MPPKKRERDAPSTTAALVATTTSSTPTAVFVGFFRAMNISGHNVIRMAVLSEVLLACGAVRCATYIQSGNVVFTLPTSSSLAAVKETKKGMTQQEHGSQHYFGVADFKARVMDVLTSDHGIRNTDMVIRSLSQLDQAMDSCPVVPFTPSSISMSTDTTTVEPPNTKGAAAPPTTPKRKAAALDKELMVRLHDDVVAPSGITTKTQLNPRCVMAYLFTEPCIPTEEVVAAPKQSKPTAATTKGATTTTVASDMLLATGKVTNEVLLFPNVRRNGATTATTTATSPNNNASELFLYFPNSVVGSKMNIDVAKKCFSASSAPTARNWLTMCAMRALANSMK